MPTTYEVHLDDVPNVPKHVATDRIEYYDSGIWVRTDGGRTFFPWGRVAMIREAETAAEPGAAEERSSRGDDESIEESDE